MYFSFSPDTLLPPALHDALATAFTHAGDDIFIPALAVRVAPAAAEYPGGTGTPAFQFELRAGATPQQRLYYSSAMLDSDAHLQLLQHLASALESGTP
jgi:hypothetical protein